MSAIKFKKNNWATKQVNKAQHHLSLGTISDIPLKPLPSASPAIYVHVWKDGCSLSAPASFFNRLLVLQDDGFTIACQPSSTLCITYVQKCTLLFTECHQCTWSFTEKQEKGRSLLWGACIGSFTVDIETGVFRKTHIQFNSMYMFNFREGCRVLWKASGENWVWSRESIGGMW